jgi:hypothetical protein
MKRGQAPFLLILFCTLSRAKGMIINIKLFNVNAKYLNNKNKEKDVKWAFIKILQKQ